MLNPLESPAFQQMLLDMLLKLVPPHIKALLQNPEFYTTIQHKASEAYRRMALIDEMNERLKRLENDNGSRDEFTVRSGSIAELSSPRRRASGD